jgi:hypothetical protein
MRFAMVLTAATIALIAQTPQSTGSVSGRVIDADSGAGIPDFPVEQKVRTDAQGYFKITGIKPGRFEIRLFGDRVWPELSSTLVNVVAGQEVTGVKIPVLLDGEMSGRVLDQNKDPISAVPVLAIGREYYGGALRYFTESGTTTNDRGEFVLRGVRAGRSLMLLMEKYKEYHQAISEAPADIALRRPAYRATYYPSADSIDGATEVRLRSGEHRPGMDIQVLRSPGFCIDGTLTLEGLPASLGFKITDERTSSANMVPGSASSGPIGVSSGADGKFRICDLYPGQFRIAALRRARSGAPEVFGAASVTIDKEDVHNVHVDAGPTVIVPGEVAWEGNPPDNASAAQFMVYAQPITNDSMQIGNTPRYAIPATFTIAALRTLEYALRLGIGPPDAAPNFYVKDVTYGPVSILHQPFRASAGTLRVTIASDAGFIKATSPPGAQILILPDAVSGEAALAEAMVEGQADYDGTYTSWRLRPGKYHVLATTDIVDHTPECIAHILQARSHGQEVEVGPSATASVTLTETISLGRAR